jgi:hypothetical protein
MTLIVGCGSVNLHTAAAAIAAAAVAAAAVVAAAAAVVCLCWQHKLSLAWSTEAPVLHICQQLWKLLHMTLKPILASLAASDVAGLTD